MPSFNRLKDCVVTNKNVIVRVDINVPMADGKIEDDSRIKAVIPTLKYLAKQQAKVIVISHFGRPEGKVEPSMSIKPLVARVQELLGSVKVNFVDDCVGEKVEKAVTATNYGEVIMLENLRFHKQETKNDPEFSRQLASLGNLYVNDAFSCSHRAHASITGIPAILKSAAGFLMESELDNLTNHLENAKKPMMAVVGGAKVSTKIDLLNSLSKKAQTIVIAGAMANTFLYALGKNIGKSLCEKDLKETALKIVENAKSNGCNVLLPFDVVVTKKFEQNASCQNVSADRVADDDIIVDIGSSSSAKINEELAKHQTLVWNGPLGAFEIKPFNIGTDNFARAAANLTQAGKLISVSGGGDSVAALNSIGLANKFTYISTAGGAFLEWLEGKDLPGVAALREVF
ncbi:MAG: phosphoglycerate kinase [Proteobacteria bacterium]|nr:phosphoglycerate kinase [Pseudomonadota bacterium]